MLSALAGLLWAAAVEPAGRRLPRPPRAAAARRRVPGLDVRRRTGAIWAEAAWGRYWAWDPKETWAFITMMINLFAVHILAGGLHSYAGL